MRICENCGEELPDNVFICWQCGTAKGDEEQHNITCPQCDSDKVVLIDKNECKNIVFAEFDIKPLLYICTTCGYIHGEITNQETLQKLWAKVGK